MVSRVSIVIRKDKRVSNVPMPYVDSESHAWNANNIIDDLFQIFDSYKRDEVHIATETVNIPSM